MGDRWINAVIKITVPLDVAPEAPDEAKRDAVAARLEDLDLPQDAVATGRAGAMCPPDAAGLGVPARASSTVQADPRAARTRDAPFLSW